MTTHVRPLRRRASDHSRLWDWLFGAGLIALEAAWFVVLVYLFLLAGKIIRPLLPPDLAGFIACGVLIGICLLAARHVQ